jgi:hypothetical protein
VSRKQKTTFHFNVKIEAPPGTNGQMIQAYLRDAIIGHGKIRSSNDPMTALTAEDFTVALVKKETVYGQR